MKKDVFFVWLMALLFIVSFVHAEEAATATGQGTSLSQDAQEAGKQAQQGLQGVSVTFSDQSNKVLEQSVQVPNNLAFLASLFGVRGGLDLRHAIVLISLWILLFLILRQVLVFTPFFGEGALSWIGGIIIIMLVALSGGLIRASNFFFELGGLLGIVRGQSLFQLLLSLVVLLAFFSLMSKILKKFVHAMRKAKAEATGETLAEGVQSAKVLSGEVKKLSKL